MPSIWRKCYCMVVFSNMGSHIFLFNLYYYVPSYFVIYCMYNIILYNILVVFILICYIGGQEELLCSHEALHLAIQNPTVYTEIIGNALTYITVCIAMYRSMHVYNCYNMGRSDSPDMYAQNLKAESPRAEGIVILCIHVWQIMSTHDPDNK